MKKHKKLTCGKFLRIMGSDGINIQNEQEKCEKEEFSPLSIPFLKEETESDFSSTLTYTSTPINNAFVIKTLKMNIDE